VNIIDFSKEKFDIIVHAGQSNSDGYAFGDVEHPYAYNEKVWYMTSMWENPTLLNMEVAREAVLGNNIRSNFSLTFTQKYIENGMLAADRKLLILRTAVGGTGFVDKRWIPEGDLYLRMMDMIKASLALNHENRIVAFLWHQGETDADHGISFDVHYKNLKTLIDSVRFTYALPELPFIAGNFVPQWIAQIGEKCEPVINAMRSVCNDIGNACFVESDGLLSNAQDETNPGYGGGDIVHFCRKSIYELGNRYFDAFNSIVNC